MPGLSTIREQAVSYAHSLRDAGYRDITVYQFRTSLDNRPEHFRNHAEAYGYAIRYTGDGPGLAESDKRETPFHDRSLIVFCDDACSIAQGNLVDNGAVLADIAGEDTVTPYWVACYSSADSLDKDRYPDNWTDIPHVIMRRHSGHKPGNSYPWKTGPARAYHFIMEPAAHSVPTDFWPVT